METDPDYMFVVSDNALAEEKKAKQCQESAREEIKNRIRSIIQEKFNEEIAAKENEATIITERLTNARQLLDRLRACAVASYYASSFRKTVEKSKVPEAGTAHHPAIQNVLRKAVTSVLSKNIPPRSEASNYDDNIIYNQPAEANGISCTPDEVNNPKPGNLIQNDPEMENIEKETSENMDLVEKQDIVFPTPVTGGRHRITKTIIVGNISKYIAPDKREANDKSTHKWMVYVRGGNDEPSIDHYVRKVSFFLHPSYRPNDLVDVCESPFHLTRRGWGEFPIRIQLHFSDPRNRRVDIIHQLRLDRSYTGLQTLGAETVCQIELDQSTIGVKVDNLLQHANLEQKEEDQKEMAEDTEDIQTNPQVDEKPDVKTDENSAQDEMKAQGDVAMNEQPTGTIETKSPNPEISVKEEAAPPQSPIKEKIEETEKPNSPQERIRSLSLDSKLENKMLRLPSISNQVKCYKLSDVQMKGNSSKHFIMIRPKQETEDLSGKFVKQAVTPSMSISLVGSQNKRKRSLTLPEVPPKKISSEGLKLNVGEKPTKPPTYLITTLRQVKKSFSPEKQKSLEHSKLQILNDAKQATCNTSSNVKITKLQHGVTLKLLQSALNPQPATQEGTSETRPPVQQFVLTTVTNNQGKQQMVLVSSDKLRKTSLGKVITAKNSFQPIKSSDTSHMMRSKLLTQEPPFQEMVANKVCQRNLKVLMVDVIAYVASHVPLVSTERKIHEIPFSAINETEYCSWNIGKQRAAEWQRASLIQQILKRVHEKLDLSDKLPSKREIVAWCFSHGYSVFNKASENIVDISSLPLLHHKQSIVPTLSVHTLPYLEICDTKRNSLDNNEVNIMSNTPCNDIQDDNEPDMVEAECQHTAAMVEQQTNMVEVKFGSTSNFEVSSSQLVLMQAVKMFTEELIRSSLSASVKRCGSLKQRKMPNAVEVLDVSDALLHHNRLNVVTDQMLGSLS